MLTGVVDLDFGGEPPQASAVVDADIGDPLDNPAGADASKWSARYANEGYQGTAIANVSFNTFRITFVSTGADIGADVINYANAPSDIATVAGRELGAVTDYPL